ncbi:MAG: hypothetical protein AAGF57_16945 [Pseudomonadota bacterium]
MAVKYTICGICEQACGLKVTTADNQVLKIEPDKAKHYSWRDYCIKGAFQPKTVTRRRFPYD